MDDIRYSEFLFLRAVATRAVEYFNSTDAQKFRIVGGMFSEMAAALIEDLYIRFEDQSLQLLVAKLRGEISAVSMPPVGVPQHQWFNPRPAVLEALYGPSLRGIRITYRGLR